MVVRAVSSSWASSSVTVASPQLWAKVPNVSYLACLSCGLDPDCVRQEVSLTLLLQLGCQHSTLSKDCDLTCLSCGLDPGCVRQEDELMIRVHHTAVWRVQLCPVSVRVEHSAQDCIVKAAPSFPIGLAQHWREDILSQKALVVLPDGGIA